MIKSTLIVVLSSDLRGAVYATVLKNGDESTFEQVSVLVVVFVIAGHLLFMVSSSFSFMKISKG